jgi:hypothetical protein
MARVDVAVAEVVAAGTGAVHLADFLEAEHVNIEASRLLDVLRRDGDVLDLGHGTLA